MSELVRRLTSRQRSAAIVLTAVAAGFIALDLTGGSLAEAHSGAQGLLGTLYRGSDSVVGPIRRYVQALPSAGSDSARIDRLEEQNAQLQNQLTDQARNDQTAAQLAKLQLAAGTAGMTIVAGRVIAFGPGQGFDWTATLDIGRSSGVAVDQTVTSTAGLVGRVVRADPSTSVVLLAADPESGVGVRDVRSGELALATGAGTNGFTVTPLAPGADLRVGDQLDTGPAGSSTYAAGLTLGTLTAIHPATSGALTATASAAVKPTTLDLVGVVVAASGPNAPRAPLSATTAPTNPSGR